MAFLVFLLAVYGVIWVTQCIRLSEGTIKIGAGFYFLTAGLVVYSAITCFIYYLIIKYGTA